MDSNGTVTNEIELVPVPMRGLYRKRRRTRQAVQAASIQAFAFESAMALKDSCTDAGTGKLVMNAAAAKAVKDVVGAWDTAAERLRILRGKGLPASVKPSKGSPGGQVKPIEPT